MTISNQESLTTKSAIAVLEENGFKDINVSISYLSKKFTGYEHYELSVELMKHDGTYNSITLKRTTTHMTLIDAWNEDESYFENDCDWYDSAEEVMKNAFDYIMSCESNQDLLREWLKIEEEL